MYSICNICIFQHITVMSLTSFFGRSPSPLKVVSIFGRKMEDNGTFNSATPGTTSPIQRLPAELLSRILRQYASSIFGRQWQKHWSVLPGDWYGWILLGDVCKDWRASIYQDSYFWSHLYLPSHDILIQLGLERSKRRSICAIVDEQYLPLESLQDSIGEVLETGRVEELHLRLRCDNGWFLEDPACMLTYARLKRLYLSMSMPHELHIGRIFPPRLWYSPKPHRVTHTSCCFILEPSDGSSHDAESFG